MEEDEAVDVLSLMTWPEQYAADESNEFVMHELADLEFRRNRDHVQQKKRRKKLSAAAAEAAAEGDDAAGDREAEAPAAASTSTTSSSSSTSSSTATGDAVSKQQSSSPTSTDVAADKKRKKMLERSVSRELNSKIVLHRGDITKLKCDAIVNAANSGLWGGGGVCGAIFRAAGRRAMSHACEEIGGCRPGGAVLTPGFALPAKHVIHAVGPMGEKPDVLRSAYRSSLDLCAEHGLRSIAFCCISTGIFGFPNGPAARIALSTTRTWLETGDNASKIDRVVFVLFLPKDVQLYHRYIVRFFPVHTNAEIDAMASQAADDDGGGGEEQAPQSKSSGNGQETKSVEDDSES